MTQPSTTLIALNKKATHNYTFLESLEAGVVLLGNEVKSVRKRHVQLKESFARIMNNELWLFNCHITPYSHAHSASKIDPIRTRKLLIHRKQLKKWLGKVQQKGLTLVVKKMYFSGNNVKVELALAQAKKLYDKRATMKEKEVKRAMARSLKRNAS